MGQTHNDNVIKGNGRELTTVLLAHVRFKIGSTLQSRK